jgi:hypothetical protein
MIVVPLLFAIAGCERPVTMDPDISPAVKTLMPIEGVDDLAHDKDYGRLVHLFASGSEPPQNALVHYSDFRYEGKNPTQSGDTATATVTVKDAASGQVRGDFKWTMTRVKGDWKLTDAPLPAK